VADPATVLFTLRVRVRPVHQATLIIPLVNAAKADSVAHADGHALRQVEVVGNQQRLAARQLQYEPLVPGALMIVRDQADDDAGVFDPAVVVRLFITLLYARIILP
jgi:hypothetical protein